MTAAGDFPLGNASGGLLVLSIFQYFLYQSATQWAPSAVPTARVTVMSTSTSVARSLSSGGHGIPWLFYVPAVLVGILTTNDVIASFTPHPAEIIGIADGAVFIALSCLWYFVLGRLPNLLLVRNIRKQVPSARDVFGAEFLNATGGHRGVIAQFGGSRPTALVVLSDGLQAWAGSGDSARPVRTWSWESFDEISTRAPSWSASIALRQKGSVAPLTLVLRSPGVLSTLHQRGRMRIARVAEFHGLRDTAVGGSQQ